MSWESRDAHDRFNHADLIRNIVEASAESTRLTELQSKKQIYNRFFLFVVAATQ